VGGKTGPDLSKVGARRKPDWLMVQIRDPKKNDHDSPMPAYDEEKINAKDLKALVAYLGSLK
jgi:cbb3-type cytochrome oxidase cytochrome c subunit